MRCRHAIVLLGMAGHNQDYPVVAHTADKCVWACGYIFLSVGHCNLVIPSL